MARIDALTARAPEPNIVRDYHFPADGELGACTIRFVRVERVPGFSHAAIANGRRVGYLSSDFSPSVRSAKLFWAKWAEAVLYGTPDQYPVDHPVRGDLGTVPLC